MSKQLPKAITGWKRFQFSYQQLLGVGEICIQLPDFSDNSFTVSGDWGPCYYINLEPQQKVEIGYRQKGERKFEFHDEYPQYLVIDSPMLAMERMETPYLYKIYDEGHGLRFEIYVDANGVVRKTDVTTMNHFEIYSRQAPELKVV